jgi:hypothetical protein
MGLTQKAASAPTGTVRMVREELRFRISHMPPGLHDPRAEVRRTEALPAPSAVGGGTKQPDRGRGQPRSRTR